MASGLRSVLSIALLSYFLQFTAFAAPNPDSLISPFQFEDYRRIEFLGVTGNFRNLQDESISQQLYAGYGLGVNNSSIQKRGELIRTFSIDGGFQWLSSENDLPINDVWFNSAFTQSYLIHEGSFEIYLGGLVDISAQVQQALDLENSQTSWNLNAGFGGSFSLFYRPYLGLKGSIWYLQFGLPLVSYVNRPKYGVLLELTQPQGHSIVLIGQNFRCSNEVGFLPMGSKNRPVAKIFYRWTFSRWTDQLEKRLTFGMHQLGISIPLYIKYKTKKGE